MGDHGGPLRYIVDLFLALSVLFSSLMQSNLLHIFTYKIVCKVCAYTCGLSNYFLQSLFFNIIYT